jgi:hypothetical protein
MLAYLVAPRPSNNTSKTCHELSNSLKANYVQVTHPITHDQDVFHLFQPQEADRQQHVRMPLDHIQQQMYMNKIPYKMLNIRLTCTHMVKCEINLRSEEKGRDGRFQRFYVQVIKSKSQTVYVECGFI